MVRIKTMDSHSQNMLRSVNELYFLLVKYYNLCVDEQKRVEKNPNRSREEYLQIMKLKSLTSEAMKITSELKMKYLLQEQKKRACQKSGSCNTSKMALDDLRPCRLSRSEQIARANRFLRNTNFVL